MPITKGDVAHAIEYVCPDYKAIHKAKDREFAGTLDATAYDFREVLKSMPDVYPSYLSAYKYIEVDGERIYESGSYAYRPGGRFTGMWQWHVRFYEHPDGHLEIYCHHELNPWYAPLKHYHGDHWNGHEGVEWVRSEFPEIDPPAE